MTFDIYSVRPIVRRHFASMSDGSQRFTRPWITLGLIPACLGAFAGGLVAGGLDVRDGVSQALAATALLVGAMLSLFVFITNLRVKVAESSTYSFRTRLHQLLGGTAAGCLYVALTSLVVAAELTLIATVNPLRAQNAQPFVVGIVVASIIHLAINLLNVVRRLFATYFELFASDFDPAISAPIEEPENSESNDPLHVDTPRHSAFRPGNNNRR